MTQNTENGPCPYRSLIAVERAFSPLWDALSNLERVRVPEVRTNREAMAILRNFETQFHALSRAERILFNGVLDAIEIAQEEAEATAGGCPQ